MDLALDLERGLEVDLAGMRAQVGDFFGEMRPACACASASATQTARQSLRRSSSEKSVRSRALPYLQENGEA